MIQLEYRKAHRDRLNQILSAGKRFGPDFKREARLAVIAGNAQDRLQGLDRTGRPFKDPWKWRVGRYEGKKGPTMAPNREQSLVIKGFIVEWQGDLMRAYYRGPAAEILGYHATGKSGKGRPVMKDGKVVAFRGVRGATTGIVRDVLGVSPRTRKQLIDLYREMARNTFAARAGRFARGVARRAAAFFGSFA